MVVVLKYSPNSNIALNNPIRQTPTNHKELYIKLSLRLKNVLSAILNMYLKRMRIIKESGTGE